MSKQKHTLIVIINSSLSTAIFNCKICSSSSCHCHL